MSTWSLTAAAGTQIIVAVAFFLVGQRLWRRAFDVENRGPALAFVAWWWTLATYLAMQGVLLTLALGGYMPLGLHIAARLIAGPLLCAGVAGLAYHIIFILSGKHWPGAVLAVYYAICALAYDILTLSANPTAVVAGDWQFELTPRPMTTPWAIVLASIGVPVILCSIAFLWIGRRLGDAEQRYRATMVGTSIFIWVGSGLLAQLAGGQAWKFVTLVLFGLAAAILSLMAYFPPGRIQLWLSRRQASQGV